VAEWLRANETALALVAEATRRSRYWVPLEEGRSLAETPRPSHLPRVRYVTNALVARALLRMKTGDGEGAAADLLAANRLAGLVAQGPTLIEGLIGIALRGIASKPLPVVARLLPAAPARSLLAGLRRLPELPSLAEKMDLFERFGALARLVYLHHLGVERGPGAWVGSIEPLMSKLSGEAETRLYEIPVSAYDWDEALRFVNRGFDLTAAGFRDSTPDECDAIDAQHQRERETVEKAAEEALGSLTEEQVREGADLSPGVRRALGRWLALLAWPELLRASISSNEARASLRIGMAALALATHREEQGRYPGSAEDVAREEPRFLPTSPLGGYVYAYEGNARAFTLTAVPEEKGKTGIRTFCADDTGRSVDAAGADPVVSEGRCNDPDETKARATALELLSKAAAKIPETEALVAGGLQGFQRKVAHLEAKIETLRRIMPESLEVDAFFNQLQAAATGSGLRVRGQGYRTEELDEYQRARVFVRLTGPPDAIEAFLPRVARLARLTHVIERRPTDDGAELTLHVFARRWTSPPVLQPCQKLDSGHSLVDCCPMVRLDLVPKRRERLEHACVRLRDLEALFVEMDTHAWRREEFPRQVALINKLKAATPAFRPATTSP
jgi:hypothetical protein